MTPTTAVIVIFVLTFLFGAMGLAVFGPPLEQRRPIGVLGWVVRGLVGLAVAHTALGIYVTAARMADFGDGSPSERATFLAGSLMSIVALGGVLVALAALLHLLSTRDRSNQTPTERTAPDR